MSAQEIDSILKYGAYDILADEDDASSKFCEQDIDEMLEQRSTVWQTAGEAGESFQNSRSRQL
jgi:hypothetical protein